MKNKLLAISVAAMTGAVLSLPAAASMSVRATFTDAALSIDAWGSEASNSDFLQTDIPAGSTVPGAFLYSSDVFGGGAAAISR